MEIDPTLTAILEDGTRLIVIYDGPRGLPGLDGDPGAPGEPGRSINILGPWASHTTYVSGDAVTSRALAAPGVDSLWIVRDGATPTPGVAPHLEPANWSEVGGGAGGGLGPVWTVTQAPHPFTKVGEPVTFSMATGQYEVANASFTDQMAIALVRDIVDAGHFVLQSAGEIPEVDPALIVGGGAWEPGRIYFLSTVGGMLQTADPGLDGWLSQPLLVPTREQPTGVQIGTILGWGPDGRLPAGTVGPTPPPLAQVGDIWYRTDAWPGLYIRVLDETGTVGMWVQANG